MSDYDIKESFKRIEDELIASMIRNMKRHRVQEVSEDKEWTMWQAEQLKALEDYKNRNKKVYSKEFGDINSKISPLIAESRRKGYLDQEVQILEAISNGANISRVNHSMEAAFFKLNDRKMNALINATTNDITRAEHAILRRSNDQYRKVIFNAQTYANSGAGTYEQAVDMATKDFLNAGIQCVQYKNGSIHTLANYADMAIKTANKRAYLTGEGEKRQEWGCHLVIMNKRGNPCPKCLPFVGKILIDDVWSGGSSKDGDYPLMSTAMDYGLYHPRCKDSHTTYFPGISTDPDDKFSKKEIKKIEDGYRKEQKSCYADRQVDRFTRLSNNSLDQENVKRYETRLNEWQDRLFVSDDENQNYIKVDILKDEKIVKKRKGIEINAEKLNGTQNSIYLSKLLKIKPRQLSSIDNNISECIKILDKDNLYDAPRIIIASKKELGHSAIASYNAKDNLLYLDLDITNKDNIKNIQKEFAGSNSNTSTYYHELIHWKDAQEYIKSNGKIKNQNEYIKWIRNKSKRRVEKLIQNGYNINGISNYASRMYSKGCFDEVYTEYLVKKRFGD